MSHSRQVESSPGKDLIGSDRIGRVRGCGSSLEPDTDEEEETEGVAEIDPSDVSAARVSPGSYVRRQGGRRAGARGVICPGHAHCIHTRGCMHAEYLLTFTASFSKVISLTRRDQQTSHSIFFFF